MKRACLVLGLLVGVLLAAGLGCASSATVGPDDDSGITDGGATDRPVQQDAPPFFQDTAPRPDGYQEDGGGLGDGPGQNDAAQADAGTCYPEPDESVGGDTCLDAIDKGSLTDLTSSHLVITGNLWPAGDVDWYKVAFVDTPDDGLACDKFNARIAFTATGNPGGRYAFDVLLDDCLTAPSCIADGDRNTNITEFQFDDTAGCPCVTPPTPTTDNVHVCVDHSMTLRIRVFRATGVQVCENYELALDNG